MDSTVINKSTIQARTMAELLPGISGILSKDSIQSLTAKKQPRNTMIVTRTAEKVIKPLTIAEMQADILALKVKTPRRQAQTNASSNKKNWNSSVKVENKFKSATANDQLKNNPVKKALNFLPKPKAAPMTRKTILNTETPKFHKPAPKIKKAAVPSIRISGVCKIAETPASSRIQRVTIANKENYAYMSNLPNKPPPITPKSILKQKPKTKQLKPSIPDTPISNISWKSNDTSFLQKEKEINDIEEKTNAVAEESTIENRAQVSPPVSTPFKEYRNVQDFFNNSTNVSLQEDSIQYHDNTIMCFDNMPNKENSKREESVIVSLCDMLNKATVTNTEKISSELKDLLEFESKTRENLNMIENGIKILTNIKQNHLRCLQHVQKLLQEKQKEEASHNNTKADVKAESSKVSTVVPMETDSESSKQCSVIKSPTYKIPKKNLCLRKKVFHKSLPNVSIAASSPKRIDGMALNMYMKMKENMNFLNTPLVKTRDNYVPDTPALTSHNLQKQLDKLYNGS